jgi:hypothetical protein
VYYFTCTDSVYKTRWQLYVPPALTIYNSEFFAIRMYLCVSYHSLNKQRLFSLNSVNQLIFATVKCCVLFAVRTESYFPTPCVVSDFVPFVTVCKNCPRSLFIGHHVSRILPGAQRRAGIVATGWVCVGMFHDLWRSFLIEPERIHDRDCRLSHYRRHEY